MSAGGELRLLVTHWSIQLALDLQAALYAALYLWAARRAPGRWPLRRSAAFLAGIGCVLVALQSGIGADDDRLLSVHMIQHMLLLILAPALLLAGRPTLLALRTLSGGRRQAFARGLRVLSRCTTPIACLAAFAVVVLGTHLPAFYDATLTHPALHDAEHVLYLIAGLLVWWPIVGADPTPAHRLGGLGKLVYLLAAMPPMALIGAYLNRAPSLLYAPYGTAAHALGINPLVDQAQAGAIMWVAGTMVLTVAGLWAAVAGLVLEERRQQARDAHAAIAGGGQS